MTKDVLIALYNRFVIDGIDVQKLKKIKDIKDEDAQILLETTSPKTVLDFYRQPVFRNYSPEVKRELITIYYNALHPCYAIAAFLNENIQKREDATEIVKTIGNAKSEVFARYALQLFERSNLGSNVNFLELMNFIVGAKGEYQAQAATNIATAPCVTAFARTWQESFTQIASQAEGKIQAIAAADFINHINFSLIDNDYHGNIANIESIIAFAEEGEQAKLIHDIILAYVEPIMSDIDIDGLQELAQILALIKEKLKLECILKVASNKELSSEIALIVSFARAISTLKNENEIMYVYAKLQELKNGQADENSEESTNMQIYNELIQYINGIEVYFWDEFEDNPANAISQLNISVGGQTDIGSDTKIRIRVPRQTLPTVKEGNPEQ